MADLAAVFHWPLSELREMEIEELIEWRKLAVEIGKAAFAVGSAMVTAIGEGIEATVEKMLGPLKWVLDKARELLPLCDARRGPLSDLTNADAAILETLGRGVLQAGPAALERSLTRTLGTAAYQDFARTARYRWVANNGVGREPSQQYLGPGKQTVRLSGVIYPHYKVGFR